ncbi:hypothetical protein VINI7043_16768, partial [Vibrio nigripulchritudo ATCC 27043]
PLHHTKENQLIELVFSYLKNKASTLCWLFYF